MRVYFEKPRTTVGWKGLINDPDLDGSFDINKGLRLARNVLSAVNNLGLPAGTEFLDLTTPQYIADLVAWAAIGARTTESQIHRELASGLSCPVGFKNGTDGNVRIAADAVKSASHPHHFMAVTKRGRSAIASTSGNEDCHIILRGGSRPNYDQASVASASAELARAGVAPRIMIDASHANSSKKPENQPLVVADIAGQVSDGEQRIIGVMIESNLVAGRQDVLPGTALTYGQSITDGCIDWQTTVPALNLLADAVAARREAQRASSGSDRPSRLIVRGASRSRPATLSCSLATAADALDLAVENGVFLAEQIVRIAQVFLRGNVAGARLAVTDRGFPLGRIFRRGGRSAGAGLCDSRRTADQDQQRRDRLTKFLILLLLFFYRVRSGTSIASQFRRPWAAQS